jgi:hypothetical protein
MPSETQLRAASAHGRFAGIRGMSPLDCPWSPISDNPQDRVLARRWLRAYRQWVPAVVDYEG